MADVSGDSSNFTGRRVKNQVNEERQIVLVKKYPDATEKKGPDYKRSEVKSSPSSDMPCNPRTTQNFSDTAINDFCPIISASSKDKSKSQIVSLSKPNLSLPINCDYTCQEVNLSPVEVLGSLYPWSNQFPPFSLVIPGKDDTISKGLSNMDISSSHKRKRNLEDNLDNHSTNKRILREAILDGVIEIEPEIWKSSGSGLIENEEVVNLVFSPGFNEGPSRIISKIEKQFKGKAKGIRRLSGIKQAARVKFAKEND
ncbi:hypothetical protein V6N12_045675 [Hibiscus sabdariffa]|uniref:Uncharacterized protein n=1 Tax=Hibiscus sabdariffa TaxID=183260 RepID=A0ABR2G3M8_9ROSI